MKRTWWSRLAQLASSPILLFGILLWLMALVVLGTLAQHDTGIYQVEREFFSSWIYWLGPLPLPGGMTTLAALTLNVTAKLCFASAWRWQKAGSLIVHVAVIALLGGGLITTLGKREGLVVLSPGESTNSMSDYYTRELVVLRDDQLVLQAPLASLSVSQALQNEAMPFVLTLRQVCRHCRLVAAEAERAPAPVDAQGLAKEAVALPLPDPRDPEGQQAALQLHVSGVADLVGTYLLSEALPQPLRFRQGETRYEVRLQRTAMALPFTITLAEFNRPTYPGTSKASDYQSNVRIVREGHAPMTAIIRMNQPLHVDDYVFYQSSFVEQENHVQSVLAVVQSQGRSLPYWATALLAFGFVVHLLQRWRRA